MMFESDRSPRRRIRRPARSARTAYPAEPLESRTLLAAQLSPVADADVQRRTDDATFAAANFGADAALRVSRNVDNTYESFLIFDLASVSSAGSALLLLAGGQTDIGEGNNNVSVFGLPTTDWVEGNGSHPIDDSAVGLNVDNNPENEIRFNNRPSNFGGALDTQSIGAVQGYQWDVTDYVQQARASGAARVAFILRSTSGAGTSNFASREGAGGPILDIADDTTAPTAAVSAPNVTSEGATSHTVTVTYTDDAGIDGATIGVDDIFVTGASGALAVANAQVVSSASDLTSYVVAYTVTPPGGSWDTADNGAYSVTINGNSVLDFGANAATGTGSFTVAVPSDVTRPVAQAFNAQPIAAAGGSTYSFTVTFSDNVGLNAGSIDSASVTVTRGGQSLPITGVTKSGAGTQISATYTVAAPGGSWSTADNGQYSINVVAGGVKDAAGNGIATESSTFQVAVPDVGAPSVAIAPIADISAAGTTSTLLTVTYSDASLVNTSTIDSSDVSVVRDGGSALAVTLVSKSPGGNAASIVAVYSVAAPGGFWNADDNGSYTVVVAPGAVADTSGNASGLAGASFEVNIASTEPVLDPAFNGGVAISSGFVAEALTTDSTGRILVAGRQGDRAAGTSQSVLQRLNADGTLDTFFGQGGQIISFPNDNDGSFAVAVDEKQRIVVAGFRGENLQVVRYDARGRLDRKFGQGGIVLFDWGGADDTVYAVAALSGGGVAVAGESGGAMMLARFDDKGRNDTSFNSTGSLRVAPAGGDSTLGALVARPDGSLIAAGSVGAKVAIIRVNAAGQLDDGFGAAGVRFVDDLAVRTDLGGQDHTVGLAVDGSGRILVGNRNAGGDFAVYRYSENGAIDAGFDDGDNIADFGGNDDIDYIGVQGTGEIVLAGTTTAGSGSGPRRLAVAVMMPDGGLNSAFSDFGLFVDTAATVTSAGASSPLVLHASGAMQTDGRVLLTLGEAAAQATSSPVRRLVAPGSGVLGTFGVVGGKNVKLSFLDADQTKVKLSIKNAVGRALWNGGVLDLVITGASAASSLTIGGSGGDKRVTLRNLRVDGDLKSVSAKNTDLVGTAYFAGTPAKVTFGSLSGTLAASGQLPKVNLSQNAAGAFVLSGVDLGDDAKVGGSGVNLDTYGAGRIGKLTVGGTMSASYVGAGVDPKAGGFGNDDDRSIDTVSQIVAVTVKRGVDANSRFAAAIFGTAIKIPQRVDPLSDSHFRLLTP